MYKIHNDIQKKLIKVDKILKDIQKTLYKIDKKPTEIQKNYQNFHILSDVCTSAEFLQIFA